MHKWRRLWSLSRADFLVLTQALLVMPFVTLGLRFLGLRPVQALLDNLTPYGRKKPGQLPDEALDKALASARLVDIAARYSLPRPRCLPRSLVLWWLLRRQGVVVDLRIGVRPQDDLLKAHAWVEYEGQVLNDQADVQQRFHSFPRAIAPGSFE